ncbi:MAG: hypothetical protein WCG86_05355 [Actinomycetota bacterium]|jgi:hypothetical protein
MRFLTVVRHAEATTAESDVERPLSSRGQAQCAGLRARSLDRAALGAYGPTTALVSAAARTRETYALCFAGTPFVTALETSAAIYNGHREVRSEDVLRELAAIDPGSGSLLVVAHYPTVWELVTSLSDGPVPQLLSGDFPLAGAFVLGWEGTSAPPLGGCAVVAVFLPEN